MLLPMATLRPLPFLAAALAVATVCSTAALGQSPARAQDADLTRPLSLKDAIGIALRNQPSIGIAWASLDASRARTVQSLSGYYPQITPSFQYDSSKTTYGRTGGSPISSTAERRTTSIGLTQNVYDTGKREASVAAAKANARASEFNLQDTRQQIVQSVTNAWYELLRARELVKVQQANVARAKMTLDATQAFADAGTTPRKDVLQAEADYDNALVQLSVAENNVLLAQTTLKNAMGLLTPIAVVVPDTQMPSPDAAPDTRTAVDYLKVALDARPDLKRELAGVDAQKHALTATRIEAGVKLDAYLTESYRFDPDRGENRSFVATLTYPLFDAGAAKAGVRAARAAVIQQQLTVEATRQSLQLEVEQALVTREEARRRVQSTKLASKAANINYEAAREAQKEGAGTIIDVITAQAQLVTAETNAIAAIYDYYEADARLQRAIGANDPDAAGGKKQ